MKTCVLCSLAGVETPVETYRRTGLEYCTFHHWLVRKESPGNGKYTLDEYAKSSERMGFRISLPSRDDRERMLGEKVADVRRRPPSGRNDT
jgi:hypothetical protein